MKIFYCKTNYKLALLSFLCLVISCNISCIKNPSGSSGFGEQNLIDRNIPRVELSRVENNVLYEEIESSGDVEGIYSVVQNSPVPGIVDQLNKQVGSIVTRDDQILAIDRNQTGLDFRLAPVYATTSGIVTEIYVSEGDTLTYNTPICKIVEMDFVKIEVPVKDTQINYVYENMPVEITLDSSGATYNGYVHKIFPYVNPVSRTVIVEVYRENYDRKLLPGMYARIKIIASQTKEAVLIPISALLSGQGYKYVFLYQPDDKRVVKTEVVIDSLYHDYYDVASGIEIGQLYVSQGQQYLINNQEVIVINQDIIHPEDYSGTTSLTNEGLPDSIENMAIPQENR